MLQEDIEAEVKACYEVLKGQGVGMTEPLVDAEGDYKGVNIPFHVKLIKTLCVKSLSVGADSVPFSGSGPRI